MGVIKPDDIGEVDFWMDKYMKQVDLFFLSDTSISLPIRHTDNYHCIPYPRVNIKTYILIYIKT